MTILITGGAKCGKSRIAEDILSRVSAEKYYIATMERSGEEAERVISRHRMMREGKGFLTIERSHDIGGITLPRGCAALLECVPTLTANEMFSEMEKDPADKVAAGVAALAGLTGTLVVVTNDVGGDGVAYSPETTNYIRAMGEINRRLAALADTVIEAVYGIPVILKGALL